MTKQPKKSKSVKNTDKKTDKENPSHKEDFDRLLTEASKGDKASDKTSKPDSCGC